ncbi:class F sortase [Streptomyces sp. NPDC102402]|uniref:class F sortase n=1 Tax=Streptomyces sp. NPDC102402 TaxID=3366169 RepID=UPI003822D993
MTHDARPRDRTPSPSGPRGHPPTRCEAEAHAMDTGRRTSTTSPQSFPAVKHLVWALVAGTALVAGGLRDSTPPQPPGSGAAAPPAAPQPATVPPAAPVTLPRAPAYLAFDHAAPEPPSFVRRPIAPPVLLPGAHVRPAPLLPLPTGPEPAGPTPASPVSPTPGAGPVPSRSAPSSRPAVQPLPPSTPLRLRIPAVKVDAPMMKLGLDAAGALEPPPDNNPVLTGWYAGGTVPGAVGTAITAGHVDTSLGPGVFHKLGSVREGAVIEIVRADQRTAVFSVYAVEVYDKKHFPDEKVYGPSARPELRVITCGGQYSEKAGYEDNVVVFAALTATR